MKKRLLLAALGGGLVVAGNSNVARADWCGGPRFYDP